MSNKDVQLAHKWVEEADEILVTASNGFAISEGLNLFANDEKLREVLGDLVDKYHLTSILMAFSYKYPNRLDYWRMAARITEYYSYNYQPSKYMKQLQKIIADRPYFIWTSNTDHHFVQAGFKNVFEIESNWYKGWNKLDSNANVNLKETLHQIFLKDQAGTLSEKDLPDKNIELNFNQFDKKQITDFREFLANSENKKLLVLELGIGPNNQLIKAPTMELIASDPQSKYITINKGELNISPEIADRSIGFSGSIEDAFEEIISGKSLGTKVIGPKKVKKLSPSELKEQEKMLQKFFPDYMINASFHGTTPMYVTIDDEHPSLLHGVEFGQSWMYSIGDAARVHCFTPDGKYYHVDLGLDKSKDQLHGFYVNPGTLVGIEHLPGLTGFSQLSVNLPMQNNGRIMMPRLTELKLLFPAQKEIIEKLSDDYESEKN